MMTAPQKGFSRERCYQALIIYSVNISIAKPVHTKMQFSLYLLSKVFTCFVWSFLCLTLLLARIHIGVDIEAEAFSTPVKMKNGFAFADGLYTGNFETHVFLDKHL